MYPGPAEVSISKGGSGCVTCIRRAVLRGRCMALVWIIRRLINVNAGFHDIHAAEGEKAFMIDFKGRLRWRNI